MVINRAVFLLRIFAVFMFSLGWLSSCYPIANWTPGLADDIDPAIQLNRKEFKEALLPTRYTDADLSKNAGNAAADTPNASLEPSIPEISDILTAPPPPEEINEEKLVSLSVTEDVPVKNVLVELGRLADVDMEIDPGITGGIIFRVKDKPFKDVIRRIADLAGLRYYVDDGVLRVERDTPYLTNYNVDFLNIIRSNTGSVSIDTKVLGNGAAGAEAGEGLSSGSSSSITSSYDGDLWTSVENTIQSILAFTPASLSVQSAADNLNAPPTAVTVVTSSYNINKQAGIISIVAPEKQQRNIKSYLDNVKRTASAQVLIEAKIVEVTLDEQYKSGIDWGSLKNVGPGVQLSGEFPSTISTSTDFIQIGRLNKAGTLASSVSLTDSFGVSRTLSSPRLHAMNNQQAVLTFAENEVYFTLDVQEEEDTSGNGSNTTLTIDSTVNTVPIGVILTLQPSINLDTQEITMNIRPTLSRIASRVSDPGVEIIVARSSQNGDDNVKSEIPVIEVRELDSILKIKSGEIMVIGGLMKEVNSNTDKGVPGAGRVPLFGHLFKSVEKGTEVVETVIFIKATIIPSAGLVEEPDKKFYKTFTRDPRPLAF